MVKKFGKNLTNNLGLKVLALFLSAILWMVVVNTEDPSVRKSMTISVTLKNSEYVTAMGKYMDILNESNTVTFYYTTKRSVWDGISNSDFSAVADMEKIEAKANGGYRVPVSIIALRNVNQITIETKQLYLDVALEDLGKQQFQIKANTTGMVEDGCALGVVEIDSANVVQVSGPASVVNSIDSVVATVNVEGMSTDITDDVVPVFYDKNGEIVDTTKLEKSVETVRISAEILNTKDVPLVLQTTGTPAEGYQLAEISSNPTTVRVKGDAATLNMLDKIVIPPEVIDLTDAVSTIEKTIDISTYLGEGISLVISSDAKVNIIVEIEPIETREYKIPVSNIAAEGLGAGYELKFSERYVMLMVTAGKAAHEELDAEDIKGIIQVDGLEEGVHPVEVLFDLNQELYQAEAVFVEVEITSMEAEQNPDGESSEDTGNSEASTQTGMESLEGSENTAEKKGTEVAEE